MNWPDDFVNKIICGDSVEIMKWIPSDSIDCIIADPPYGVDYDGGHFHSGSVKIKREREKLEADKRCDNVYAELFPAMFRLLAHGSGGGMFFMRAHSHITYTPPVHSQNIR